MKEIDSKGNNEFIEWNERESKIFSLSILNIFVGKISKKLKKKTRL